jgi:methylenetetrahydrofolate dehydrogenase (NADP+) / methenyltetrahydrofolate cyclohydrolase
VPRVTAAVVDRVDSHQIIPGLAVVLVGTIPRAEVYVSSKKKTMVEAGMRSFDHRLPGMASEGELLALIARLNNDPAAHGILVQLPLPPRSILTR